MVTDEDATNQRKNISRLGTEVRRTGSLEEIVVSRIGRSTVIYCPTITEIEND